MFSKVNNIFICIFSINLRKYFNTELKSRIFIGFIIFLVFLGCFFANKILSNLLLLSMAIGIYYEFSMLVKSSKLSQIQQKVCMFYGLLYATIPFSILIRINGFRYGSKILFWYFIVIWATDCGAYFFGKLIKGKKLAPNISKGKTISGFVCGLLIATTCGGWFGYLLPYKIINKFGPLGLCLCGLSIAFLAQLSDLLESFIKRKFDVKDSGTLLLGHGGVMDRMDSVTFSSLFLLFMT